MNHFIKQNETCIAHVGDRVTNIQTTICGLVAAFTNTSGEVACYHLPFMDCSSFHMRKLTEIMGRIGPISNIVIVTNDFQSVADKEYNFTAIKKIKETFGVRTTYYIMSGCLIEDISVTLQRGNLRPAGTFREMDISR